MSATLEGFQPMVPGKEGRELRIEHVYTGASTVEPLPYLVNEQRQSDRLQGRGTWVLVGSPAEEAFLVHGLRSIFQRRAQEEGRGDDDKQRWGVRGTQDMEDLAPDADAVVVTTTEYVLIRLMAAEGAAPRQFSQAMTFMLDMGWGNLPMTVAYAYNKLVRFVFDNKETCSHFICTISTDMAGAFNTEWVEREQDCRVTMEGEAAQGINFWDEAPRPAMAHMFANLQDGKEVRAVVLMDHLDASELENIGPILDQHFHVLSASDDPELTWNGLADTSKHVITNGAELTQLGSISGVTHVILYPWREGYSWDKETSQVVFHQFTFVRPLAELKCAMRWRDNGKAPDVHYMGSDEGYDGLEDEPMDSMVYTSNFENHVLTCLSVWPGLPVVNLPLKVGRNPDLIEERLRRLMYKGLVEVDKEKGQRPAPEGLLRFYGFLRLTPRGRVASELVNPFLSAIDSVHVACMVGQLFVKMRGATPEVMDAVCSLATVLTSKRGVTYIASVIKPLDNYKVYGDYPDSLAFAHCHRGPVWLAVCVLHFTMEDSTWKSCTRFRGTEHMDEFTTVNGRTLRLFYRDTFEWENVAKRLKPLFEECGKEVRYADAKHRLAPKDLLEVEDMLATAFMDKLAFVFVPGREGAFGYSMTTLTELERPTDEQMRLIDLQRCWEEDKAALGRETPGIYCIFTHCRMGYVDGRHVTRPFDLTHVSTKAVKRALGRVDEPMIARNLFTKIETDYKLEL